MTHVVPISLGGLLVSIATLAWTMYKDLRKPAPRPTHQVVARIIPVPIAAADQQQGGIINIIVDHSH